MMPNRNGRRHMHRYIEIVSGYFFEDYPECTYTILN